MSSVLANARGALNQVAEELKKGKGFVHKDSPGTGSKLKDIVGALERIREKTEKQRSSVNAIIQGTQRADAHHAVEAISNAEAKVKAAKEKVAAATQSLMDANGALGAAEEAVRKTAASI